MAQHPSNTAPVPAHDSFAFRLALAMRRRRTRPATRIRLAPPKHLGRIRRRFAYLGWSLSSHAPEQLAEAAYKCRSSTGLGWRRRQPARSLTVVLPAQLSEISAARHQLYNQLHVWNLVSVADGAVMAANELIANAVVHGCQSANDLVTMTARWSASELLITVKDSSRRCPQIRCAPCEVESGRGLNLVEALADRWGVMPVPLGVGKRVWMAFDLRSPAGRKVS